VAWGTSAGSQIGELPDVGLRTEIIFPETPPTPMPHSSRRASFASKDLRHSPVMELEEEKKEMFRDIAFYESKYRRRINALLLTLSICARYGEITANVIRLLYVPISSIPASILFMA
jgi:hypothetical protein